VSESDEQPITLSSERAYDGRLLRLRVDRVRLPSGRETTREVIEHPGAVVILPVTRDGRIWFVEQFRYAVDETLLELPAGLIDAGEAPIEAAHRELREEVGLAADTLEQIGLLYPSAGYSNEHVHIFVAAGCEPVPRPSLDEGLTIRTLAYEELAAFAREPRFPLHNAATAFAILWYIRRHDAVPQMEKR
jgi:ADP-ribose pyrophosphatase